jgi:DNA-binding MurR/RpiR family transcriptional regulator
MKRTDQATLERQLKAEKDLTSRMTQIDEVLRIADDKAWKLTVRDIAKATGFSLATTHRTMLEMGLIKDDYCLPRMPPTLPRVTNVT